MSMDRLMKGAKVAVQDCMAVKSTENVLIVTDTVKTLIAEALAEASRRARAETVTITMDPRKIDGEEPPRTVAAAMREANVVLMPATKSLTNTKAREEATKTGARIASMPGITERMFMDGGLNADYSRVKTLSYSIADLLTKAKKARITTSKGTNLSLDLGDRKCMADTGILHSPGDKGNLPSGVSYMAPIEESAEGIVLIDGSINGIGLLKRPVKWVVKAGRVTDILGREEADKLKDVLKTADENATLIGAFGMGTNPAAKLSGMPLEDEKVLGTAHLAIGSNHTYGGKIRSQTRITGFFLNPTIELDEKVIMKDGEILIS